MFCIAVQAFAINMFWTEIYALVLLNVAHYDITPWEELVVISQDKTGKLGNLWMLDAEQ